MSKLEKLIQQYCPDGVEYVRLDKVANVCRGTRVVKSQLSDTGYPVYQNCLTPMGYFERSNCNAGTTFVICGGAAGNVGYTDVDCWAADDCEFIIGGHQVINRYIYYYLMTKQNYLLSKVRKASIPRLSPNIIKELEIPVPPLPVQEEIVRILDTFTELQAELQKRKQQYNFYRDNLLNFKDINRGGQEIKWMKLGDVAYYVKNRITSSSITTSNYVSVENLLQDKQGKTIASNVPDGCLIHYEPGDVLIGNIRPYLKKIWLANGDGGTNGDVLTIRADRKFVSPEFLYQCLASDDFFQYDMSHAKGAKMPRGSKEDVMNYKIPITSLSEQQRIVSILDRFDTLTNDLTSGLPAEMEKRRQQYEFYRDKLLTFKRKEA